MAAGTILALTGCTESVSTNIDLWGGDNSDWRTYWPFINSYGFSFLDGPASFTLISNLVWSYSGSITSVLNDVESCLQLYMRLN